MEKLTITTDEVYEYAIEGDQERNYLVKFMTIKSDVVKRRIHALDFEHAYRLADHIAYQEKFDRIISIEEI